MLQVRTPIVQASTLAKVKEAKARCYTCQTQGRMTTHHDATGKRSQTLNQQAQSADGNLLTGGRCDPSKEPKAAVTMDLEPKSAVSLKLEPKSAVSLKP